jgi:hypothetical protein
MSTPRSFCALEHERLAANRRRAQFSWWRYYLLVSVTIFAVLCIVCHGETGKLGDEELGYYCALALASMIFAHAMLTFHSDWARASSEYATFVGHHRRVFTDEMQECLLDEPGRDLRDDFLASGERLAVSLNMHLASLVVALAVSSMAAAQLYPVDPDRRALAEYGCMSVFVLGYLLWCRDGTTPWFISACADVRETYRRLAEFHRTRSPRKQKQEWVPEGGHRCISAFRST